MVTSSIIYTTFSIYFLFSQLVTVSQCAPSPVVAYSPPSTPHNINTVISTQKLQKCPPCPKDTSLSDTNKALVSKLRCPPQIGNCTANNALAKPTTGALKGRDCCGCKRHRRNGCNATTVKMVDVLPTPPILMKMKGQ
uniref:Uncharacterized protein n=1 Tax=Meloidogyne floridensis TaxID=298350 RepID=A0A915NV58_9BILA